MNQKPTKIKSINIYFTLSMVFIACAPMIPKSSSGHTILGQPLEIYYSSQEQILEQKFGNKKSRSEKEVEKQFHPIGGRLTIETYSGEEANGDGLYHEFRLADRPRDYISILIESENGEKCDCPLSNEVVYRDKYFGKKRYIECDINREIKGNISVYIYDSENKLIGRYQINRSK
jgi:hypothetical protein